MFNLSPDKQLWSCKSTSLNICFGSSKRTNSVRCFFWAPATYVLVQKLENLSLIRQSYLETCKFVELIGWPDRQSQDQRKPYGKCSKISNTSSLPKQPRQTAQTLIRLLPEKQSDQGLHSLLFWHPFCEFQSWKPTFYLRTEREKCSKF